MVKHWADLLYLCVHVCALLNGQQSEDKSEQSEDWFEFYITEVMTF